MKTLRTKAWHHLLETEAVYRLPPFLIDLLIEADPWDDLEEVFRRPAFLNEVRNALEGSASLRMPKGFAVTAENLSAIGYANGFTHYVATSTNFLVKRANAKLASRSAGSTHLVDYEEFRAILQAHICADIPKFDPCRGRQGSCGFEAYLKIFTISRTFRLLFKILTTRLLLQTDLDAAHEDEGESSLMDSCGVCEERTYQLQTPPCDFVLGTMNLDDLTETLEEVEVAILSGLPRRDATLFLLAMGTSNGVNEIASRLGLSLSAAYRSLEKVSSMVLRGVQSAIAAKAGLDIGATRKEILGYFLGTCRPHADCSGADAAGIWDESQFLAGVALASSSHSD